MNDENPFGSLALPIDFTLPAGDAGTITAIRPSSQLPESIENDPASGWINVQERQQLAEVVYDTPDQTACTLRLPLDPAGDIRSQIEAGLAG
jgi:hypothetical protein